MGPDSVLVRGVLWLLFQGHVFAPDRDLISEGAYMRMRGAKQWKWTTDASFRSVHDITHEDIRGNYEPLGMFWVVVAWVFFLIGSALTARGIVTEQYTHIAFCALALVPLLLGVYRVSKARYHAKLEMVRRAFENERSARQEGVTLEDDERTAVVAHHIVLSYLEEVLETCVYGTSATHIDRMRAYERATANKNRNEAAAAADGQGQQEGEANNANNAQKPPSAAPAQGLNGEKDVNKPPAQILMSAAQGLRGNTKRGGLTEYMMNTPYPCCSQGAAQHWWAFQVMKVSSRLQNISQFCEQSVDVTMYKYGWHKDTDLRQAAVMKATSKLRESSRPGLRCFIAVAVVGLCNLLLIGVTVAAVLAARITWQAYVSLAIVSALVLLASVVMLWRKLPVWSIVDGVCSSARKRVDAGQDSIDVCATTDLATRALDMSLRVFDDRGELQSCAYWRQMVPQDMHSGVIVPMEGIIRDGRFGNEHERLYGNISGPLSGPLSAGFNSPNASWRTLPEPECPSYASSHKNMHSGKTIHSAPTSTKRPLSAPVDPNVGHIKPENVNHTRSQSTGAAGRASTSAVSSSSGSGVGVDPTVMGQDPTVMESLAAAEGPSVGQDEIQVLDPGGHSVGAEGSCALLSRSSFFQPSKNVTPGDSSSHVSPLQTVESENAVRAAHAVRAARAGSAGSGSSPPHRAAGSGSFAFLVPHVEGGSRRRSGSRSSTALSSSAGHSAADQSNSPVPTPLEAGASTAQSPRDGSFHSAIEVPQGSQASRQEVELLKGEVPEFQTPLSSTHPSFSHMLCATSRSSSRDVGAAADMHHQCEKADIRSAEDLKPRMHEGEQHLHATRDDDTCDSAILGPGPGHVKADEISLGESNTRSEDALQATSVHTAKDDTTVSSAFVGKSPVAAAMKGKSNSHGIEMPSHDSRTGSSFMSNERGTESGFSLKLPAPCLPAAVSDDSGPRQGSVLTLDDVNAVPPAGTAGTGLNSANGSAAAMQAVQSFPVSSVRSGKNSEKLNSAESAPYAADSPVQRVQPQHAQQPLQSSGTESPANFRSASHPGCEGLQLFGENDPTFVDILNATPDGPVGQDVANDALAMLRSLGSRSDADLLMAGGTPGMSPMLESSLSRGYSGLDSIPTEGEAHLTPREIGGAMPTLSGGGNKVKDTFTPSAVGRQLPTNTRRMHERHVFNGDRKLALEKQFLKR